jgi:hypothetical protein
LGLQIWNIRVSNRNETQSKSYFELNCHIELMEGTQERRKIRKHNKFSDPSTVLKFSLTLSLKHKIMSIEFCAYDSGTGKLFKIHINLLLCWPHFLSLVFWSPVTCLLVCSFVVTAWKLYKAIRRYTCVCDYLCCSFFRYGSHSRPVLSVLLSCCWNKRIDDLVFQTFTISSFICIAVYM